MKQPEGFVIKGKEHMGCRLKQSIYGLKQASRQWYLKFDQVITEFEFKENTIDSYISRLVGANLSFSFYMWMISY
jgi:Reverse transcriptase (RNA-dependent DNA polymerase)